MLQQRRILLTLTFAIAAKYILLISAARTASYAGIELTVGKPELLIWVIWIAWVWAVYRYWQYARTFNDQGTVEARNLEIRRRRLERIRQTVQRGVDDGIDIDKGFEPGTVVIIRPESATLTAPAPDSEGAWIFGNVVVLAQNAVGAEGRVLSGGANCTLNQQDVQAILRKTEHALKFKYP